GTGAGETISYVLLNSAAQEEVPDAVLGRVLGVISFVHRGAHATGLLLVAPLFAVAAARPLFGVAACATAAVGVVGALLATRLLPVLDVHRHLDETRAWEIDSERAHAGKPAALLAHERGDLARHLERRTQVDVEGDQRPARTGNHGACGRVEPRRPVVRAQLA